MRKFPAKKRILQAVLVGTAIIYLIPVTHYWSISVQSNELLLVCYLLRMIQGISLVMAAGVGWIFMKGLREKRLGIGAVPMVLITVSVLGLSVYIQSVYRPLVNLRADVRSCQLINMATVYQLMLHYWADHDYKNPPGTGPNGVLTQEDWHRALEPYRRVWADLRDENGRRMTLFKCPADPTPGDWSYEINLDAHPSPGRLGTWYVREKWSGKGDYHRGYGAVLYPSRRTGYCYMVPERM